MSDSLATLCRLGFNDGWLVLGPTFLNFGLPVLLVDEQLTGPPGQYGFVPLATSDPRAAIPSTCLHLEIIGPVTALWSSRPDSSAELLAVRGQEPLFTSYPEVTIMVVSTFDVELSWSALWAGMVGSAPCHAYGHSAPPS